MSLRQSTSAQESWGFALRHQVAVSDHASQHAQLKVLILAALKETDGTIVKFGQGLNDIMQLLSPQDLREVDEALLMAESDRAGQKQRKMLKDLKKTAKKGGARKTVASKSGGVSPKPTGKDKEKNKKEPESEDESRASSKASKTTKGGAKKGKKKKKK